jgi:hypothetical protein
MELIMKEWARLLLAAGCVLWGCEGTAAQIPAPAVSFSTGIEQTTKPAVLDIVSAFIEHATFMFPLEPEDTTLTPGAETPEETHEDPSFSPFPQDHWLERIISRVSRASEGDSAVFEDILSLYEVYDIVHIGERHWNMTDYKFRVGLINHPGFVEIVDDIVIESGNYLYQDLLDIYILDLEDVPQDQLCKVWRNTVLPTGVWDATIYKEFVYRVREVNEKLPRDQRVRLIAAEPPIDWSKVHTAEQASWFFSQRCTHTARVVETEVLNNNRKALIIYGGAHFFRSSNTAPNPGRLRTSLEERMRTRLFTILPLSGEDEFSRNYLSAVKPNKLPSFVRVHGSTMANFPGILFFAEAGSLLVDFTDGIVYFGQKPDSVASYDPLAANDTAYQKELKRRKSIFDSIVKCAPNLKHFCE